MNERNVTTVDTRLILDDQPGCKKILYVLLSLLSNDVYLGT